MKPITPLKFGLLLALVAFLLPALAFGDGGLVLDDNKKPEQGRGKDAEQNTPPTNQPQPSGVNPEQNEAAAKSLFKDATYENFAAETNSERKIIGEEYFEKQK